MWGLKGFKRWVFLGAVVAIVVLLAAAWVMRVELIRTTLDPRIPFQTYKPPRAPNYAEHGPGRSCLRTGPIPPCRRMCSSSVRQPTTVENTGIPRSVTRTPGA